MSDPEINVDVVWIERHRLHYVDEAVGTEVLLYVLVCHNLNDKFLC